MARVSLLILAHFLWVSALAQSGGPFCSVPAGGGPMPFYFYSTNNRASGNAMVGPADERGPRYFTYAALKIQGYVVKDFVYVPGEPQPMSIGLEAVFDSTVFASGSIVAVQFEALDSYGVAYTDIDWAPVKNKIGLAQLDEWNGNPLTDGIEETNQKMSNLGWQIEELSHYLWSTSELADLFAGSGIYHVSTHGYWQYLNPLGWVLAHMTDEGDDIFARQLSSPFNAEPNYETWRTTMNGSGYPPFNSTAMPPVTLAFLDACTIGGTSEYNTILLPWLTSYGDFVVNQAFLGYPYSVRIKGSPYAARILFNYLREGMLCLTLGCSSSWRTSTQHSSVITTAWSTS